MGLTNSKVLKVTASGEAIRTVVCEGIALEAAGLSITLADAQVLETGITSGTGQIIVSNNTDEDSYLYTVHMESGTPVLNEVSGASSFSNAASTANKLNVYVDAGEIKVENLLGGDRHINVSAQL